MANNGWVEQRLGDLIEVRHGWPFKSKFFSEELTGRPIVVNIGNFEYSGGFRFSTTKVKEYRDTYPKEYELSPGEILLVMTCQTSGGEILGIPARVPNDRQTYLHNQRLGRVVVKRPEEVDLDFLYWVFLWSEFNRELFVTATGTKILHTAPTRIENFRFCVPPIHKQRRIANILGSLDGKIDLNRRMNETLEAMVRRLFRSWFVDFDPVHAKAALRREHTKLNNTDLSCRALPNMAPKIAELFPDSFEDSTLGPIPKGWAVGRLCEHTEAQKGLSYKGSGLSDTGLPLHNLNSVFEGGGYKFEGIKFYTGEFKDRHIIRPGEVIVANTEQGHDCLLLGYAAIVPYSFGDEGLFSHHIFRLRIRPESPLQTDFLCQLLNSQRMHDLVSGYGNGTTVNMLPIDGVEQPQFVVPPKEIVLAFNELAANVRAREIRFVDENSRLAKTRDLLLPRLLSGELLT